RCNYGLQGDVHGSGQPRFPLALATTLGDGPQALPRPRRRNLRHQHPALVRTRLARHPRLLDYPGGRRDNTKASPPPLR
ncbi:unnamed protein product, partial [Ectocarpus sp. 13 AM-2016]